MSKIKISRELETLGQELSWKCPNNECRVFRDAYNAYKNMIDDRSQLMGYVSSATMAAIDRQIVRTVAKMYDIYYHNKTVKEYVNNNRSALKKRFFHECG